MSCACHGSHLCPEHVRERIAARAPLLALRFPLPLAPRNRALALDRAREALVASLRSRRPPSPYLAPLLRDLDNLDLSVPAPSFEAVARLVAEDEWSDPLDPALAAFLLALLARFERVPEGP